MYQVVLIAVGYGKLRVPFLRPRAASFTHRSVGDAIVAITFFVAFLCLAYFGIDGDDLGGALHIVAGSLLLAVLILKIVVVRRWDRMGRYLPLIGTGVFVLFCITWLTSAGAALGGN